MVSNAAPQFFVLHDGLSPATGRAPQLTAGRGGLGGSYGETCNLRGSTATAADRNSVTIAGWTRCGGAAQRSSVAAARDVEVAGSEASAASGSASFVDGPQPQGTPRLHLKLECSRMPRVFPG